MEDTGENPNLPKAISPIPSPMTMDKMKAALKVLSR